MLGAPRERVGEALATVDLADAGDRLAGTLSGGQRSRVSLASALLGRPELLVLDEPTVGLDPVLRRDLWALFHRLADGGATLLVSSHVMDEAARCDRLLLMREGELLARHDAGGAARAHRRAGHGDGVPAPDRGAGAMSARITAATAVRVLAQIRHDPRTIALLLVVPSALLWLLSEMLGDAAFDRIGGPMLGMFPFITMFLVTSIAMLRERTTGTLERLMTMPLAKLDLLAGYAIAFALLAAVQALVTSAVAFLASGFDAAGAPALIAGLAVLERGARLGARPARQRVRLQRVPGRAVHARVRAAADPPLRPARAARADGRRARRGRLGRCRSRSRSMRSTRSPSTAPTSAA